ncbi:bleomycin hydrolase [Cryptotrichosporon argae]
MGAQISKPVNTAAPAPPPGLAPIDEKASAGALVAVPKADEGASDAATLPTDALRKWAADFESSPTRLLSQLVLSNADPVASLQSRAAVIHDEKVFNLDLRGVSDAHEYPGPRVNQQWSGRCWLFATTNVLRYNVIEQLKLGEFQLSQNYLFFYDKLEKANYFLENVLDLPDEPLDGRLLSYLFQAPVNDGGQWDMAYNLIQKYGIVPRTVYPEAYSSTASAKLDTLLTSKLREYALALRARAASSLSSSSSSLRKLKSTFMAEVYATVAIALGTPPTAETCFKWEYYDKAGKFHVWAGTPREFYAAFGRRKGMDPKDSFSLLNDPRNAYGKLYTVKRLGNVLCLTADVNAPNEVLEDAIIAGIKANTPLFFGCDVGKQSDRTRGIMDADLYDLEAAYGYKLGMSKAERLRTGDSAMTHAMVITAVHVDAAGRPVRYKVENSWSDTAGERGWFMMTAEWFRQFAFQVVVPRALVDPKWAAVLDSEPVELEAWDPMGALA